METAEEFTICKKAREGEIMVSTDPKLRVVHQGAPKTLFDFIKNEVWRGKGDWTLTASIFLQEAFCLCQSLFKMMYVGVVVTPECKRGI